MPIVSYTMFSSSLAFAMLLHMFIGARICVAIDFSFSSLIFQTTAVSLPDGFLDLVLENTPPDGFVVYAIFDVITQLSWSYQDTL